MNKKTQDQQMEEHIKKAKVVFDAIQKQRKGAIEALQNKATSLLDNGNLTMEKLGSAELVSVVRDFVQSTNSTLLALESHDRLIDFIIKDLSGTVQQTQEMGQGLMHVTMMAEVMIRALKEKGVLSDEDISAAQQSVLKDTRDAYDKMNQGE